MLLKFKKYLSLIATVLVIVVISIAGYYLIHQKRGPYASSDLVSISYGWGLGDTLLNNYNSATHEYQYLNAKDSLIKTNVKLRANNIIFIHSKANELDLWNLPSVIANKNADLKSKTVLRYEIVFNYQEKVKKIIFLTNYDEDILVKEKVEQLQKIIAETINEVEDRYTKP